jgi:hypothetical protein
MHFRPSAESLDFVRTDVCPPQAEYYMGDCPAKRQRFRFPVPLLRMPLDSGMRKAANPAQEAESEKREMSHTALHVGVPLSAG